MLVDRFLGFLILFLERELLWLTFRVPPHGMVCSYHHSRMEKWDVEWLFPCGGQLFAFVELHFFLLFLNIN